MLFVKSECPDNPTVCSTVHPHYHSNMSVHSVIYVTRKLHYYTHIYDTRTTPNATIFHRDNLSFLHGLDTVYFG